MKQNKNQKNTAVNQITEGVIWKQLLIFFFPILFGTLFQQIYNTADTVVVGRFVGKEALAAVGGSSSMIVNLIVGFFVGLCSGASVVISQFYGAKDHKNLKKALHTSMIFCLAASIIVGTAGFILAEPILHLMKTPAEVIPDSVLYLHIYFAGTFFNLVYNMVSSILRAVGDSKRPLYVLIITCLLNILLDVVFVVIFHMGVLGVALATVSCQAVSAILVTWFLMRAEDIYRLEFHGIRFDLRSLGAVLRIGLPAGLESVMYNIANLTIQIFVNELGTDTVAAWGTMGKIDAVFWMVCNAFAISITTFVGQNYGAGKKERIRTGIREGVILTILINIPLALMLLCIPEFLTSFMLNDASIISYPRDFLAVTGICLFPLGWLFVFRNGCQGMGHTFVPMLSGVLEVSLRVVMVKLLTPYLAFRGVALAEVSAWIGAWIMLMITYWIYQERTDSFR